MTRRPGRRGSDDRQDRLAAALRANLAKRKALARVRDKGAGGEAAEHAASDVTPARQNRPDTDEK